MNVFVLCTGRCGSTTLIKAAKHISNFTAGHETRSTFVGNRRLAYPTAHIEADNRLSWFLGRLDRAYGKDAFYIHLQRDLLATAESFCDRWDFGIMKAYRADILMGTDSQERLAVSVDYCETVNENIRFFLKDKPNVMDFKLENAMSNWELFWNLIKAEGDFENSLMEWEIKYNARKHTPII